MDAVLVVVVAVLLFAACVAGFVWFARAVEEEAKAEAAMWASLISLGAVVLDKVMSDKGKEKRDE